MTEFKYWVAIVSLIILCLFGVSWMIAYQSKQIKRAEMLINRLEDEQKKLKKELETQKEN